MNKLKQKGSIALFVAFGLFLLIGILAITLEFGYMHAQKNKLQNVADAVALACINIDSEDACGNTLIRNTSSLSSSNCTSLTPCGPKESKPNTSADISSINTHGFTVETTLPVTCNIKDTVCAYAKVSTTWKPIFLQYFMSDITRTAEATAGGTRIGACFIVKDTLSINGTIDVALDACSASIGKKLETTNRAGINIYVPGSSTANQFQTTIYNNGINTCSPGICNPTPRIVSAPLPVDPPYTFGSPSGTSYNGIAVGTALANGGKAYTLEPGIYSNGINLGSNGTCVATTGSGKDRTCVRFDKVNIGPNDTVTFKPGTYFVTGDFYFSNSGNYSGNGVSFFLQNNTSRTGLFRVSGDNVDLKASAPTICGSNSDILIYRKPDPTAGTLDIKGNNKMKLEGVLFFPNDNLTFSGTATNIDIYGTIIANNLSTNGNVKNHTSPDNCYNKGTRYKASLVY